jgi:hypothetical protein
MKAKNRLQRRIFATSGLCTLLLASVALITAASRDSRASGLFSWRSRNNCGPCASGDCASADEIGGTWHWLRSPDEEKRVVISLYNRYCVRCHGIDGRGVWDMPDVPNFTNERWQDSRSDGQLARILIEGRGAVMPAFRGTLSLEESWAMARHLRTFRPGTEATRPDLSQPEKPGTSPR